MFCQLPIMYNPDNFYDILFLFLNYLIIAYFYISVRRMQNIKIFFVNGIVLEFILHWKK